MAGSSIRCTLVRGPLSAVPRSATSVGLFRLSRSLPIKLTAHIARHGRRSDAPFKPQAIGPGDICAAAFCDSHVVAQTVKRFRPLNKGWEWVQGQQIRKH
jgi:hypothetical protein